METEDELHEMTVAELKDFLIRQDIDVNEVESSGRTPRPVKRDLLKKALEVLREFEAQKHLREKNLLTPEQEKNPFQQSGEVSYDGHRSKPLSTHSSTSAKQAAGPAKGRTTPMTTRRQSAMWIDSGLLGKIEETMITPPNKEEARFWDVGRSPSTPPGSSTRRQEEIEPLSPEFKEELLSGSGEEFVSDWSDEGVPYQSAEVDFARSTVKELKDYLDRVSIPYEPRARKAELVALARANHALQTRAKPSMPMPGESPDSPSSAEKASRFHRGLEFALHSPIRATRRLSTVNLSLSSGQRRLAAQLLAGFFLVLFIGSLMGSWIYYGTLPFCPSEKGSNLKRFMRCRPCPENASCFDGKLFCDKGFVRSWNRCVADREIQHGAATLMREIKKSLDLAAGRFDCNYAGKALLTAEEILTDIRERVPKIDTKSEKFNIVFEKALVEVQMLRDVTVEFTEKGTENCTDCRKLLYMSTTPRRGFGCQMRKLLLSRIRELAVVFILLVIALYVVLKIGSQKRVAKKVHETYKKALDLLQEHRSAFDDGRATQPYLVDTHLRDELLTRERQSEKTRLWVLVEKKMSYDTRILRSGPKKVYGVPCNVWEWKAQLLSPRGAAKKKL